MSIGYHLFGIPIPNRYQFGIWYLNPNFFWYFFGIINLNPRPGREGVDATTPEVFLRCTPNCEADRAEILYSLWGILCATFGKKILTGSCQVTEL